VVYSYEDRQSIPEPMQGVDTVKRLYSKEKAPFTHFVTPHNFGQWSKSTCRKEIHV